MVSFQFYSGRFSFLLSWFVSRLHSFRLHVCFSMFCVDVLCVLVVAVFRLPFASSPTTYLANVAKRFFHIFTLSLRSLPFLLKTYEKSQNLHTNWEGGGQEQQQGTNVEDVLKKNEPLPTRRENEKTSPEKKPCQPHCAHGLVNVHSCPPPSFPVLYPTYLSLLVLTGATECEYYVKTWRRNCRKRPQQISHVACHNQASRRTDSCFLELLCFF